MTDHSNEEACHYRAFISYSHKDGQYAVELHRFLETYRIPKLESASQAIPARMFPIFRDREELPVSANLSDNIRLALEQSQYLLVICTKNSAASRWVGEEVRTFKALGRADRIFCLTVDPEASHADGYREFYPPMLNAGINEDGSLLIEHSPPIFIGDRSRRQREEAYLQLIARLTGAPFAELHQRDAVRKVRRLVMLCGLLLFLLVLFSGLSWFAMQQRNRAVISRRNALIGQSRLLYERACLMLDAKKPPQDALAYLAAAVRADPQDQGAVTRLVTLLTQRSFLVPAGPPITQKDGIAWVSANHDGTRLVIAGQKGQVTVWDPQAGRPAGISVQLDKPAVYAAYGLDDRWLLTVCADGSTGTWDAQSGRRLRSLIPAGDRRIVRAVMSPNGKQLVLIDTNQQAVLWQLGGTVRRKLLGQAIVRVEFNPNGQSLIAVRKGACPVIYNALTGQAMEAWQPTPDEIEIFGINGKRISDASFSPPGHKVVICYTTRDGDDAATGNAYLNGEDEHYLEDCSYTLPSGRKLRRAHYSPDQRYILLSAADDLFLVNTREYQLSSSLVTRLHIPKLESAFFTPNGLIVTHAGDGTVSVWRLSMGGVLPLKLCGLADLPTAARFSPDGRELTTFAVPAIQRWDTATGELLATIPIHLAAPPRNDQLALLSFLYPGREEVTVYTHSYCALSADNRLVVYRQERKACVYDLRTGKPAGPVIRCLSLIDGIDIDRTSRYLLITCRDGTAQVREVASGRMLGSPMRFDPNGVYKDNRPFPPLIPALFTADGTRCITISQKDTGVRVWDWHHGGKPVYTLPQSGLTIDERLVNNGQHLICTTTSGLLYQWDIRAGKAVGTPLRCGEVTWFDLSADNRRLVTGGSDSYIRVWNLSRHQLAGLPVFIPYIYVSSLALSPDGRIISAACDNQDYTGVWMLDADTGMHISDQLYHQEPNHFTQKMFFDPVDRRLFLAGQGDILDFGLQIAAPAPEWLPDLAEAVAARRLTDGGDVETLSDNLAALQRVERAIAQGKNGSLFTRWGKWLFADPRERTISPFASITVPRYSDRLLQQKDTRLVKEAVEINPSNTDAVRKYRRLLKLNNEIDPGSSYDLGPDTP